jgi:hypothetical protein
MKKTQLGEQRYNNRMDKIFENYKQSEAKKEAAYQEMLKCLTPEGIVNYCTEKLKKGETNHA